MRFGRKSLFITGALFLLLCCVGAGNTPKLNTFEIDPAQSTVQFTVESTLHTVHGSFKLKPGSIQFDPAGGPASGQFAVDAASGDSENKSRDKKMTNEILEAAKFAEISFAPQQMKGTLAPSGPSQFQLEGMFTLHGQAHSLTLDVNAVAKDNLLTADTSFEVPYIQWGLKNPSALFLKVSDKVQVHIHAVGKLN